MSVSTIGAGVAFASADPTSTSTTNAPSLLDHFTTSYFGVYSGPSLSPNNDFAGQPGPDGKEAGTQGLESYIGAFYKLGSSGFRVGANIDVVVESFREHTVTMNDPFASIVGSKFLDSHGWTMGGDVRVYTPISAASQTANLLTGMRTDQWTSYTLGRWTAGAYTFARVNAFYGAGDGSNSDLLFDISPNANYQLTERLAVTFWTDIVQLSNQRSHFGLTAWTNAPIDFQTGVAYQISKLWTVNPFINVYPGSMSVASTSLNAILIGKFY